MLRRMQFCATVVTMVFAVLTAAAGPCATLDRFKHFQWTENDGAPGVTRLAQSVDGYLWIASGSGLFRFDGVTFEKIQALNPSDEYDAVTAITQARGGGVWVGYRSNRVARYIAGRLIDMRFPAGTQPLQITGVAEAKDGALWVTVGRGNHHLWRYLLGRWEAIDEHWGLPRSTLYSLMISRNGTVWVVGDASLLFLPTATHRFRQAPIVTAGKGGVTEDSSGQIWYFDDHGTRLVSSQHWASPYPTPPAARPPQGTFAADGSLWGATWGRGLYRIAAPNPAGPKSKKQGAALIEFFDHSNGLSSDAVGALLSDREGNVWIGTSLGLDMFRRADIVLEKALAEATSFGDNLATDTHGNVYVGQEKALMRIRPGGAPERILQYSSLDALCAGPSGEVWVALAHGIKRVPSDGRRLIPRPPTPGVNGGLYDCAFDRSGTLWVTAGYDGLFRRAAKGWEHFPVDLGLSSEDIPDAAVVDLKGRLVTRYRANMFSIIDYPYRTAINLGGPARLHDVRTLYSGPGGVIAAGDFGLMRWKNGKLQPLLSTVYPWLTGIRGVAQTKNGETWLMARAGMMRLSTPDLERAFLHPGASLRVRTFDMNDGMPNTFVANDWRSLVEGGDGRLWFATVAGIAWLDPKQITQNVVAPTVLIRALVTEGRRYRDPGPLRLTAGTSAIEIDYTATSLSIPRRVQFRYRLVGVDRNWVNPGRRRQAFYTNLRPGTYSFQVLASNNDGVWSRQGARLEFTIPPTFVESWWFVVICGAAFLALLWLIYSVRLRQVSAALHSRLEERLGERERIARELHDTLLQGIHGLILRFQSIAERIPPEQPTRDMIEGALDRADQIMVEGRERVSNLRSAEIKNDLPHALVEAAARATAETSISTRINVQGEIREIHAITADEVLRIANEALFNTVMHAQASLIEVALIFGKKALQVRISDDGIGLDQLVMESGARSGHYGLIGMRERAERIHAELILRSRPGAGTEVALSIPAAYAYACRQRLWRRKVESGTSIER